MNKAGVFFFLILSSIVSADAQDKTAESTLGNAASNATTALAFVTKLQVQPDFTLKDHKAVAGENLVIGPDECDVTSKFQINAMFPPSNK